MVREYTTDITDVITDIQTMARDWATTHYSGNPETIQAAERIHHKATMQAVRKYSGPGVSVREAGDGRYVAVTQWRPGRHKIEPVIRAHAMASIDEIRQSVIDQISGTL